MPIGVVDMEGVGGEGAEVDTTDNAAGVTSDNGVGIE
jgi:hypothetical protein